MIIKNFIVFTVPVGIHGRKNNVLIIFFLLPAAPASFGMNALQEKTHDYGVLFEVLSLALTITYNLLFSSLIYDENGNN